MWGVVFTVMVARVYLGAHLPIDVVGGAALGWAIGSLSNLAFGTPAGHRTRRHSAPCSGTTATVASAEPLRVDAAARSPTWSAPRRHQGVRQAGEHEERDADALFKSWRLLSYKSIEDEQPFLSAKRLVEEALTAGLSAVRVPAAPALASVLTFRLATYWLPNLPGWLSFRHLRRVELLR